MKLAPSAIVAILCTTITSVTTDAFAADVGALNDSQEKYRSQVYGVARPQLSATLRSTGTGTIAQVLVREGQNVRAGDALVSLDDRLARAHVRIAEIEAARTGELNRVRMQLKLAERQLDRMRIAFKSNAISEFELEEQLATVEQAQSILTTQAEAKELAKANCVLAVEQLRSLTIFAPFDGVITQLHNKIGDSVDPSVAVVSIVNMETLDVELHTPTELYGQIKPNESIPLMASAPLNEVIFAKVVFASPIVNSASNTFRCVLRIDNTVRKLPAGFSVTLAPVPQTAHSSQTPLKSNLRRTALLRDSE
jgi:membrane fusion protein (multidrug efflux system)